MTSFPEVHYVSFDITAWLDKSPNYGHPLHHTLRFHPKFEKGHEIRFGWNESNRNYVFTCGGSGWMVFNCAVVTDCSSKHGDQAKVNKHAALTSNPAKHDGSLDKCYGGWDLCSHFLS